MTPDALKAEIETVVTTVENLDARLPGAATLNVNLDTLKVIVERPLLLTVISDALTAEGL